jgi:hypothetical protein
VLLNDPQYVESARVLAEDVLRHGTTTADRTRYAFRRVISRMPSASEATLLSSLHDTERARFAAAPDAATALLATGDRVRDPSLDPVDVAAWTVVASTIMNLDEAVHTR